jgi:DNA primase
MGFIPEEFILELKSRAGIYDVVSSYVSMRKKGVNYFGLCPFHDEKTPSFSVNEAKGIFKCFGCGMGGGVIDFVMDFEKLTFPEAVGFLAEKVGMPPPVPDSATAEFAGKRRRLEEAVSVAASFFHEQLLESGPAEEARGYLVQERGLTTETIERWQLGYAPDSWDSLIKRMQCYGFSSDDLFESGLVVRNENNHAYDFFRNRIIFPIHDAQGKVKAFAGRAMDKADNAKYINSPETAIYSKRRFLYGLHEAVRSRSSDVLVVEGYMDKVMASQYGMPDVVALGGTELGEDQAYVLMRFFKQVGIALDPDAGGKRRTAGAAKQLMKQGLRVRVINLPKDLDEALREEGVEKVRERRAQGISLYDFELERCLEGKIVERLDADDKLAVMDDAVPFLDWTASEAQKLVYLDVLAKKLGVPFEAAVKAYEAHQGSSRCEPVSPEVVARAEFNALLVMVRMSDYLSYFKEHLKKENFRNLTNQAIFSYLSETNQRPVFDDLPRTIAPLLFDEPLDHTKILRHCAEKQVLVDEAELEARMACFQHASAKELDPHNVLRELKLLWLLPELRVLNHGLGRAVAQDDLQKALGLLKKFSEQNEFSEFLGESSGNTQQCS